MKILEINKQDLENNIKVIKETVSKNTKIIAVVKANGMGLDLIKYSKFLIENEIKILAVANVEEAMTLREAGIKEEILMLTPVLSKNDLQLLIKNDITIAVGSSKEFELAEEIAGELGKEIIAHIKIDTGFARYGFLYSQKEDILKVFENCKNVKIQGIFSHFSKPIDEKFTKKQFDRFLEVVNYIKQNNYNIEICHICASTAFLKYPEMHLDAVRIGSAFQGRVLIDKEKFTKVGIFKTNILEIKEIPEGYNISYNNTYKTKKKTKIAIIPVGYIDGLNRVKARDDFSLKNNLISVLMELKKVFKDNSLKVKIHNKQYKIIGKLGMYHAIIDITNTEDINIGDEVILNITPLQTNDKIRREYI